MVPKCGVCHTEDSKYKCPVCELRYCSLNCYKSHKPTHENINNNSATDSNQLPPKKDRPGTTQRIPTVDFTGFEKDKDFLRLLSRYPLLKVQLQAIYGLTLDPGPDEARTWNRQPLPGSQPQPAMRGGRGRSRARGQRGGRGVRRGGWDSMPEERQRGPWTQEKGDKEALATIKKMRSGDGEPDDLTEGTREFVELCRIKFGGDDDRAKEAG